MIRCRVFLSVLCDDPAVSVSAALGFYHHVVELVALAVPACSRVCLALKRHGRCTAELRSADIPVTDIELLLASVCSEVLTSSAHKKGIIALVSDKCARI